MRVNFRLILFFFFSVIEVIGEAISSFQVVSIVKPLLMPALAFWWIGELGGIRSKWPWVLYALVFSTFGDILLLFARQNATFFLFGLVAFLLAHLFYIKTFLHIKSIKRGYLLDVPLVVIPFIFFLLVLMTYLWSGIPFAMKGAVMVYALVITIMALSAFNLWKQVSNTVFYPILAGALLFMLSDSLIAVNKFGQAVPYAGVLIMATYILGQLGIIWGLSQASAAKVA